MNLEKPEVTGVQTVSRHDERITTGLGTAPVYRKSAEIIVTIASGGEEIITTLADGTVETKNTASAGDAIVTNPGESNT